MPRRAAERKRGDGDLSVTALYTAETWRWGGVAGAELLATPDARAVFRATNAALALARLGRRDLPSLRHSLLHRHAMIDRVVRDAGVPQVLELAAGLSPRGLTASADPDCVYTEVDLPPVIARKRTLLERSPEGRTILERPNLRLVPGDVAELDLETLVRPGVATAAIAEGLLMYLAPPAQRDLWRRIAGLARVAAPLTFVFDLVPACEQPPPGRVGRSLEWMMKRFTRGRSFQRDLRTRHDLAAELREVGFGSVETVEPSQVATRWSLPFPEVPTQQLLFVCRA